MRLSQSAIFALYAASFLLGIALGLLYDGLRITRIFLGESYSAEAALFWERELPWIGKVRKKRRKGALRALVFAEDFLFCLVAGVLQILLFYQLQNGNVRIPAILLALIGFFAYRATVGRPIMWCSERIAFCAACAVRYVLYVFLWPARTVRSLLRRLCSRAITAIRKRKRISYTKRLLSDPSFEGLGDGRTKKRREHRVGKKKAIQSDTPATGVSDDTGHRFHRRVHRRRDAV